MRGLVASCVLAFAAEANAGSETDLLHAVPMTVAVSSTVANAKISPKHLVDGMLDTAWNSRTGDLVGAWISVRIPDDAQVSWFELTAGFTHFDKGDDWFTMNPRIKTVIVSHDGRSQRVALDPGNRGLQKIPVTPSNGAYKITVAEIVPGTKPSWREIAVSELRVMGTTAHTVPGAQPIVAVGATERECQTAMYPRGLASEVVERTEVIPLSPTAIVCRVDHHRGYSPHIDVDIAQLRGQTVGPIETTRETVHVDGIGTDVSLSTLRIAPSEDALLVTSTSEEGPSHDDRSGSSNVDYNTQVTLYRASSAGQLADVYHFDTQRTQHSGKLGDEEGDRCELAVEKSVVPPAPLVLNCEHAAPDGTKTLSVKHLHWTGSAYDE